MFVHDLTSVQENTNHYDVPTTDNPKSLHDIMKHHYVHFSFFAVRLNFHTGK
jgi:hypothetical protein